MQDRPNADDARKLFVEERRIKEWLAGREAGAKFLTENLKYLILINGGAALALLAFVSKVAKGAAGMIPALMPALNAFAFGVLMGGLATRTAYLSEAWYTKSKNVSDKEKPDARAKHERAALVGKFLIYSGFACFAVGVMWTAVAMYLFKW